MTYKKLYEDALFKLDRSIITLGEFEEMIKPLDREVEQEPKTGHWIFAGEENEEETRNGNFLYVCSECCHSDVHAKSTEVPYCWYCGAKMEEVEE